MFNKINYVLKMFLYKKIIRKDTMELQITNYRGNGARIGKNVRTFSPIYSSESYLIEVRNNVTISMGVKFVTHDNSATKIIENSTDLFGKIIIGDNCFIGINSILMPGVTLVNNIVVGSGSVVTKSFTGEGIIIGGNPAKKIGTIESYRNKNSEYAFNTFGLSYEEKKKLILANEDKLIKK